VINNESVKATLKDPNAEELKKEKDKNVKIIEEAAKNKSSPTQADSPAVEEAKKKVKESEDREKISKLEAEIAATKANVSKQGTDTNKQVEAVKADNTARVAKSEADIAERKALEAKTIANAPTGNAATDASRQE